MDLCKTDHIEEEKQEIVAELRMAHLMDLCPPQIRWSMDDKRQIKILAEYMEDRPEFTMGDFMKLLIVDMPLRRARVFSIFIQAKRLARLSKERV